MGGLRAQLQFPPIPGVGSPFQSRTFGYLAGCRPALRPPVLDPPTLHSPPARGPRTPGLRRTEPRLSRSCRGAFRSPRPSPKSGQADETSKDALHLDVQKLKEKRDTLDKEINQLISEGYSVDELEAHISQLHEYNDVKDVGQMLLGKLAVIRGVTTKELYPEFGLDVND
ncbi:DNA repair protein SWI5 homolog [Octodon degus]|uniref:DNA repair protein SWI5 homolog n=1 Tax=Octodon degus TaxID=10160 RepID=A0A6P6D840_OCTDE|nr:DNA repair protein SWI5 homolog [Octodon degus]